MKRARNAILLVTLALGLAACGEEPWRTRDIAGAMPDLAFELTAGDGRRVTAADYRGQVTLVFFGFTHCPDVCPTTLAHLAAVLGRVDDPDDVRVLFVTVDPARDSLELLRSYTEAFGPRFVGLRGDRAIVDEITHRYGIAYSHASPDEEGHYTVSHSSVVLAFDRDGEVRLLIRRDDPVENVAADLQRLLDEF